MRRVSGNPAKRAAAVKGATGNARKNSGNTASKSKATAPAVKRPRFLPASRAGWRLTLIAAWVIITGIAVPTGFYVGKAADDEYTFVMVSFTLPLTLLVAFCIPFFALAAKGGLSKIPLIGFTNWPSRRGRILIAALAIAAAGTLITIVQSVYGDIPVGLMLVTLLAIPAVIRDTIHVIRRRRNR